MCSSSLRSRLHYFSTALGANSLSEKILSTVSAKAREQSCKTNFGKVDPRAWDISARFQTYRKHLSGDCRASFLLIFNMIFLSGHEAARLFSAVQSREVNVVAFSLILQTRLSIR